MPEGRDVAPLRDIVDLAQRHRLRVLVDEAHGTGTIGPGGRGAAAAAGVEDQVDVILGTLGKALGSYGAFVACDREMSRYGVTANAVVPVARTRITIDATPQTAATMPAPKAGEVDRFWALY